MDQIGNVAKINPICAMVFMLHGYLLHAVVSCDTVGIGKELDEANKWIGSSLRPHHAMSPSISLVCVMHTAEASEHSREPVPVQIQRWYIHYSNEEHKARQKRESMLQVRRIIFCLHFFLPSSLLSNKVIGCHRHFSQKRRAISIIGLTHMLTLIWTMTKAVTSIGKWRTLIRVDALMIGETIARLLAP